MTSHPKGAAVVEVDGCWFWFDDFGWWTIDGDARRVTGVAASMLDEVRARRLRIREDRRGQHGAAV